MTVSALSFAADTHTYRAGGVDLISVTTAIRSAGLMGDTSFWSDEARDRGTYVHQACEWLDQGDLDETTLDDGLRPYLDAYRWFLHDHAPTWSHIEARGYNAELRYAGTVDRAGTLKGDSHACIVDIKSGAPAPWHAVQASAYKRLPLDLGPIIYRRALYLSADGTYQLIKLPLDDRADWTVFQAALSIAWFKRTNRI